MPELMVPERKQIGSAQAGGPARWLVVVVLTIAAGALLVEWGRTSATAYPGLGESIGAGPNLLVVPTQLDRNRYGVYLVDPDQGRMCLYEYSDDNRLRLLAARNFTYDLKLDDYNTLPSPRWVQDLVHTAEPTMPPATTRPSEE